MSETETNSELESSVNKLSKATHASKARILKVLGETACEKRVLGELRTSPRYDQQLFDPYYNEKHEFAKRKLVHLLYSSLGDLAKQVNVRTEVSTQIGRFDVAVTAENAEVVVEIKTGLTLNLAQVERYLTSGKKIVLVRIPLEQVTVLRPGDHASYLAQSNDQMLAAVRRLLDGAVQPTPGPECSKCPIYDCEFNAFKNGSESKRVTPHELGADFGEFSSHLYPSLEKVVNAIIAELGISLPKIISASDLDLETLELPAPSFPEVSQSPRTSVHRHQGFQRDMRCPEPLPQGS
jgi:hypothetical protein